MSAARLTVQPLTYADALGALGAHSTKKIGNNTYLRRDTEADGSVTVSVQLHATKILTFHDDGTFTVNTGGYRTATTRERLRSLGVQLYVCDGMWSIGVGASIRRFDDGMRLRMILRDRSARLAHA